MIMLLCSLFSYLDLFLLSLFDNAFFFPREKKEDNFHTFIYSNHDKDLRIVLFLLFLLLFFHFPFSQVFSFSEGKNAIFFLKEKSFSHKHSIE